MFSLLKGEESCRLVMDVKQDVAPDRSGLANSNVGNIATNARYGGGRGHGHGGHCGEGRPSGHGRGTHGVGRGYGQPYTDCDKPYCTHCGRYRHTREMCWELNGKPRNVSATPVETEYSNDTTEQETGNHR